jgi:HTH-type transcriptional regulator / antitoxin HigA
MDIAPIKTQRDYGNALKRIEHLMTAKSGTAEGDHLDVLVTLVSCPL